MSLDEWINRLSNNEDADRLTQVEKGELREMLLELAIYKALEVVKMCEAKEDFGALTMAENKMTEREQFYYGKGYADGRKELVKRVCDSLEEEFYNDDAKDYYAGFDAGLKRAMRLIKAEV